MTVDRNVDFCRFVRLSRRRLLQAAGASALAGVSPFGWAQTGKIIRIGYVSPETGPLAGFGEVDPFMLAAMNRTFKAGIPVAGKTYPVEIIVKDSQSNPNRA